MKKHILPLFWCFIIFSSSVNSTQEEAQHPGPNKVSAIVKPTQQPLCINVYNDWRYYGKVMDKNTDDIQNVKCGFVKNSPTIVHAGNKEKITIAADIFSRQVSIAFGYPGLNNFAHLPLSITLLKKSFVPVSSVSLINKIKADGILDGFGGIDNHLRKFFAFQ